MNQNESFVFFSFLPLFVLLTEIPEDTICTRPDEGYV